MIAEPVQDGELDGLFHVLASFRHMGLAVSGGGDSVALMHLAARWRALKGGNAPHIAVLTVDHGLRPGSAEEAREVGRKAAALGLPHATLRWRGGKPETRIQAAARLARYDLMSEYAHARGLDCLVTAHHLDDQAETLLMRLRRGSGIDGLSAIPEIGRWAGMPLIRPLLDIASERLKATLRAAGTGWTEDPANADDHFERVRLRKAMPALGALGITAKNLAASARRLRRARAALDETAREFLREHGSAQETGYCELDRGALNEIPEEIALRALGTVLELVRGMPAPFSLKRLERLTGLMRGDASAARTLGGCRFMPRKGKILVVREAGRQGLEELLLEPGAEALWDRRFHVAASGAAPRPVTVRALGREGIGELRARARKPLSVPAAAAAALVSFWQDGQLVSVPPLAYHAGVAVKEQGAGPAAHAARFVNSDSFADPSGR